MALRIATSARYSYAAPASISTRVRPNTAIRNCGWGFAPQLRRRRDTSERKPSTMPFGSRSSLLPSSLRTQPSDHRLPGEPTPGALQIAHRGVVRDRCRSTRSTVLPAVTRRFRMVQRGFLLMQDLATCVPYAGDEMLLRANWLILHCRKVASACVSNDAIPDRVSLPNA